MEIFNFILLFVGGLAGGFYGSSVGGGAILTFPLLLFTGMPVHLALGTQRFAQIVLEFVSAVKFYREKRLYLKLGMALGSVAVIGSVIGANVVIGIDEKILNLVVGIMLVAAAIILFNRDLFAKRGSEGGRGRKAWLMVSVLIFGVYAGFFGVGSAVLCGIMLIMFGYPFVESSALARVIGVFVSVAGSIVFAMHGLISVPYGLVLGAGFGIGSWVGLNVALKQGEGYMQKLVLAVIFVTLVKLASDFFGFKIF